MERSRLASALLLGLVLASVLPTLAVAMVAEDEGGGGVAQDGGNGDSGPFNCDEDSGIAGYIFCILPMGEDVDEDARGQQLLFKVIAPFMLVFAVFYYVSKVVMDDKEAALAALALALFFIGSGAGAFMMDFFFELFGLTGAGIGVGGGGLCGTMGEDVQTCPNQGCEAIEGECKFSCENLNQKNTCERDKFAQCKWVDDQCVGKGIQERIADAIVNVLEGDLSSGLLSTIMWLIILVAGFGMINVWRGEGGGIAGTVAGIAGVMTIGWVFASVGSQSFMPDIAQRFGEAILQGVAGLIIVVILLFAGGIYVITILHDA